MKVKWDTAYNLCYKLIDIESECVTFNKYHLSIYFYSGQTRNSSKGNIVCIGEKHALASLVGGSVLLQHKRRECGREAGD